MGHENSHIKLYKFHSDYDGCEGIYLVNHLLNRSNDWGLNIYSYGIETYLNRDIIDTNKPKSYFDGSVKLTIPKYNVKLGGSNHSIIRFSEVDGNGVVNSIGDSKGKVNRNFLIKIDSRLIFIDKNFRNTIVIGNDKRMKFIGINKVYEDIKTHIEYLESEGKSWNIPKSTIIFKNKSNDKK